MRGAQYLHAPIPMVSGNPFEVKYRMEGEVAGYRRKVYKDTRVEVSPESLTGSHLAWDIREAYDELWDLYESYIFDRDLGPGMATQEVLDEFGADHVFCSVPAPALCSNMEHTFNSSEVFVTEYYRGTDDDTVVCSGDEDVPWYRTSSIQGWANTEYPKDKRPPLSEDRIHPVRKPIITNCNCWMGDDFTRIGRYGKWRKGVLSHQSYYDTFQKLSSNAWKQEHNQ